jgi:hypothetical protein
MCASFSFICISNNPELSGRVRNLELLEGTPLEVLKRARDLVHLGWSLVSSPFYGNFQPWRTPYRTVVLKSDDSGGGTAGAESALMIESAVLRYEASGGSKPAPPSKSNDSQYRQLDAMLIDETLERFGLKYR